MTTQRRASHSYASLWMLVAVTGLDHVRWLAGPHFLPPTPLTLHPALPESCPPSQSPHPSHPQSVSMAPLSPLPAPTPSLRGCLPRPPSCLQCDSGLFVGLPFPKGCQHLGPPPSFPQNSPLLSASVQGFRKQGLGFPLGTQAARGGARLPPFIPYSPLLCRTGHTPYPHPLRVQLYPFTM